MIDHFINTHTVDAVHCQAFLYSMTKKNFYIDKPGGHSVVEGPGNLNPYVTLLFFLKFYSWCCIPVSYVCI